jgi:hypothetical protein
MQLSNEIFAKQLPGAIVVLVLCDEESTVLLIHCSTVGVIVATLVVSTYNACASVGALKGHHCLPTKAGIVLSRLIQIKLLGEGTK